MLFVAVTCIVLGLVAGVTESTRIINAVDRAAGELHARIKSLEDEIHNIKFPLQ